MLGVKPSYATGFAQWPGMSEYPGLWNGLVGAWDMSLGATGNKVFDLSGNGNTGTLVANTHWVPGKFGSALDFDGSGDYVQLGDLDALKSTSFTFVSEIIVDDLTGEERGIFNKWTASNTTRSFTCRVEKNGAIIFATQNASTITVKKTAAGIITTGVHYQIAVSYDYEANDADIYVNDVLVPNSVQDDVLQKAKVTTTNVNIGAAQDAAQDPFNGRMGYFYVYNRTFTASEIAEIYQLRKKLVT